MSGTTCLRMLPETVRFDTCGLEWYFNSRRMEKFYGKIRDEGIGQTSETCPSGILFGGQKITLGLRWFSLDPDVGRRSW